MVNLSRLCIVVYGVGPVKTAKGLHYFS